MHRVTRWFMMFAVSVQVASAQSDGVGREAFTEGTRYMVGFPQVSPATWEKPTPRPLAIVITSRADTRVTVTSAARSNDAQRISRVVQVRPGEATLVDVPTTYMPLLSESKTGYGIELTSDHPIAVWTTQAWGSNGELSRHLPVAAWGKEHMTVNYFQDRFGRQQDGYHHRPASFLIIAQEDETVVTYVPTVRTEGGSDHPSVPKGGSGTVTLQRGETMLVRAAIDPNFTRDAATDLTGTFIASSKPVAVISGHTKVGVLEMPDLVPPIDYPGAQVASFVRNNIQDVMLPSYCGGNEFITIPQLYTPTRKTGLSQEGMGVGNDRGDVVRIIALEDDTRVARMRADGQSLKLERTLRRGESYLEQQLEAPTFWNSSKPVIVAQYGKSWVYNVPPPAQSKDADVTQGGPTIAAGVPMLSIVPPIERWVSRAAFVALESHDNFVSIAFTYDDASRITFDGVSLTGGYANSLRTIAGTPYAIVRFAVAPGYHEITSDHDDVRWCAMSYGSMDGIADGRAYGAATAIDMARACSDSVVVEDAQTCGNVTGTASVAGAESCSALAYVFAESSSNYAFRTLSETSTATAAPFTLTVVDRSKPASATIRVLSTSGRYRTRTYTYTPQDLDVATPLMDLGPLAVRERSCRPLRITNPTTRPVQIDSIRGSASVGIVAVQPRTLRLDPGASADVDVCIEAHTAKRYVDTIHAWSGCDRFMLTEIRTEVVEPCMQVGDQVWLNIPPTSTGVEKPVEIRNISKVPITITDYDRSALQPPSRFRNPRALDERLPITLGAGAVHTWYVQFVPGVVDTAPLTLALHFESTATCGDSIALLTASLASTIHDESDGVMLWLHPNPADDHITVRGLHAAESVYLIDPQGQTISVPASDRLDVSSLPPGPYMLKVVEGGVVRTARFVVVR